MIAKDVNVDTSNAVDLVLFNLVNNVDNSFLFRPPRHGIDAAEKATLFAILGFDRIDIFIDIACVVWNSFGNLHHPSNFFCGKNVVAINFDITNLVTNPFVDVVMNLNLRFVFRELQ